MPVTRRTRVALAFVVAASVALALAPTAMATGTYNQDDGNPDHLDPCLHYHYVVGAVSFADIPTVLIPGATVIVNVTIDDEDGCDLQTYSFVSYNATSTFALPPQTVHASETKTFGTGTHELTITVPPCYYQIDFVYGHVIQRFNETSGTYHGGNRFIDGSSGGAACQTQTTSSSSSTTSTTGSTTTGSSTTTTSDTGTSTAPIPFFPTGTALVLGVVGALIGSTLLLRRKL